MGKISSKTLNRMRKAVEYLYNKGKHKGWLVIGGTIIIVCGTVGLNKYLKGLK